MSDAPDNMEQFNFAALAILDALFESFPTPVLDFHPGKVCLSLLPDDASFEDSGAIQNIADATLTWLASEGFLVIESRATSSGGFGNVRLTLKGLALLGSVPQSISGAPKPLSQRIRDAMTKGAQYAGAETMKALVGEVIKFGMA